MFLILCIYSLLQNLSAKDSPNTITFDNKSGEPALVKVIGPSGQIVEVPNGQNRTVNAAAGEYYILVRYGSNPEKYRYAKGNPFIVTQTDTQYSSTTITLHKIVDGNYPSHPISAKEFEKMSVATQRDNREENIKEKKYGIPKLTSDQLWASSIPTGCSVYLVPKDNFWEKDISPTGVNIKRPIENKEKYFKCKTPCFFTVDPGEYYLGYEMEVDTPFQSEDFVDDRRFIVESVKQGGIRRTYDPKGNLIAEIPLPGNLNRKWYIFEKKENTAFEHIGLFQLKNASLKETSSLYPMGNNFIFNDEVVIKKLTNRVATKSDIDKAIELLHRGGKIALKGKIGTIVVEITGNNQGRLSEEKRLDTYRIETVWFDKL